ncbi:hypothetical protein OTU49_015723 [Cherax quadricarinatus]|uniref:Uncharacterized protein n=1 Tax=Cherax quadricarinatus TaxID=27406 RepID=A0AAW0YB35_CHEQU|nr:C-type mannose receptor 2-like isoform X2 [Cherax quadricarinatus]
MYIHTHHYMIFVMGHLGCFVATVVLSLASSSDATLIFDATHVKVITGESLALNCGVEQDFRHCVWENDRGNIFQVEDVHTGFHHGMRAPEDLTNNQCGIIIDSVSNEDLGEWRCTVHLPGRSLTGSRRVEITEAEECLGSFLRLGGECYYFHEDSAMNWQDARDYCRSLGSLADLAVVNDCHQLSLIWNHILMYYETTWHWIGGNDKEEEGSFYFVDGSAVPEGTPFWRPGAPESDGDCLNLSEKHGYFNDYPCDNVAPFICQQLSEQYV